MPKPKNLRKTVRLDPKLLEALEKYCERNFADQSTVIRTALAQWPPIKKILEEMKNPSE